MRKRRKKKAAVRPRGTLLLFLVLGIGVAALLRKDYPSLVRYLKAAQMCPPLVGPLARAVPRDRRRTPEP